MSRCCCTCRESCAGSNRSLTSGARRTRPVPLQGTEEASKRAVAWVCIRRTVQEDPVEAAALLRQEHRALHICPTHQRRRQLGEAHAWEVEGGDSGAGADQARAGRVEHHGAHVVDRQSTLVLQRRRNPQRFAPRPRAY